MTRVPRLSVVLPTYQRRASVRRALEALSAQTLAADAYEVVVAIDGSTDGTRELVAAFTAPYALRAVCGPNRGRAAACNAGVAESRGAVVVLLDDDMEPRPACLAAHLEAHPPGVRRGVLGAVPVEVSPSAPPVVRFVGTKFNRHLEALARAAGGIGVRDFYSGNFSIRRDVLLEVGGFDESFHLYGNEDVDLAARLLGAGVELAYSVAAAAVQHYEKDFVALARDHVAKGQTAVLCARKHPEAIARLRIGTYRHGSRRWRLARAMLLAVSDHAGHVPAAAMRLVRWAERRWPAQLLRCYPLALDYFFWYGVRTALRDERAGPLAAAVHGKTPRGHPA